MPVPVQYVRVVRPHVEAYSYEGKVLRVVKTTISLDPMLYALATVLHPDVQQYINTLAKRLSLVHAASFTTRSLSRAVSATIITELADRVGIGEQFRKQCKRDLPRLELPCAHCNHTSAAPYMRQDNRDGSSRVIWLCDTCAQKEKRNTKTTISRIE